MERSVERGLGLCDLAKPTVPDRQPVGVPDRSTKVPGKNVAISWSALFRFGSFVSEKAPFGVYFGY